MAAEAPPPFDPDTTVEVMSRLRDEDNNGDILFRADRLHVVGLTAEPQDVSDMPGSLLIHAFMMGFIPPTVSVGQQILSDLFVVVASHTKDEAHLRAARSAFTEACSTSTLLRLMGPSAVILDLTAFEHHPGTAVPSLNLDLAEASALGRVELEPIDPAVGSKRDAAAASLDVPAVAPVATSFVSTEVSPLMRICA